MWEIGAKKWWQHKVVWAYRWFCIHAFDWRGLKRVNQSWVISSEVVDRRNPSEIPLSWSKKWLKFKMWSNLPIFNLGVHIDNCLILTVFFA
jgi:hypothetical protein